MNKQDLSLKNAKLDLRNAACSKQAEQLSRYFKTGPGEYGEGDIFLGLRVPDTRKISKKYKHLKKGDILSLLKSKYHEERQLAIFILVINYQETKENKVKNEIFSTYTSHLKYINNWDLIDLSAPKIVGAHLYQKPRKLLKDLVKSKRLWDRRVAVLSTFYFVDNDDFELSLKFAELLLRDEEDLIHKATGWMLREIGKRSITVLENFLMKHYMKMPRTMLRYSIEKLPEARRKAYLKGEV